jgi:preprotein translocase subunit SecA
MTDTTTAAPAREASGATQVHDHGPAHDHAHGDACGCGHDHHHHGHHHHAPVVTYHRGAPKTGRNDPCPCGSGRKYKKCCLEAERA